MNESLFDPEPHQIAHTKDPWTSYEAAMKALKTAKRLNLAILEELGKVFPYGLTDEELAERLSVESTVSGNSVAKRRSTLKSKGLIVANTTKTNHSGNKVTAWKLAYAPNPVRIPYEPTEKKDYYHD